jgi:hypothetical protein
MLTTAGFKRSTTSAKLTSDTIAGAPDGRDAADDPAAMCRAGVA